MTSGDSMNPHKKSFHTALPELIPYFGRANTNTSLWAHLFSHLQVQCRNTITNPYVDAKIGFHTAFYEIREHKHSEINELWKQGPLYDHPLDWYFRKSAYTVSLDRYMARLERTDSDSFTPDTMQT